MNKQSNRFKIHRSAFRRLLASRPAVLVGIIMVLFAAMVTGQGFWSRPASAVQTMTDYCSQYVSSQNNACKDGIRGADCNDYAIIVDQATADICTKAAKAKADGQVNDTVVAPSPTTTPSIDPKATNADDADAYKKAILAGCASYKKDSAAALWCLYGGLGQNGTEGKPKSTQDCLTKPELQGSTTNQEACITGSSVGQSYLAAKNGENAKVQDQLDQSKSLSQLLDVLHAAGPDAKTDVSKEADNNYGSYVNGAGKQQKIKVTPGPAGGPALLFFNGGGWHANDHTSDFVAAGSPDKNGNPDFGSQGAPPGGGATARGYTVFDVTYRLGSSGIYYMFEDVMRGIQHVTNNASMYGIDPGKVAIWGDSAGGSLAMRAAGSGKSGAKVAVGWSPPTNAFTGLFRSYKSLMIGMDHSTCAPTDLAGLANITDLLNGGSGNVAEYGQGLSSNDFGSLGINGDGTTGIPSLSIIGEVLTAAQYAATTGQNVESISKQLESGGIQALSGGVFNLSSKKLVECIDNFRVMSPAMFASPMSPPAFLAGFDNDDVVGPEQVYGMRDKLRSLGIRSEAKVLEGDPNAAPSALGATVNHLGYDSRFVCPTLNFVDSVIQPDKQQVNCGDGSGGTNPTVSAPSASGGSGSASAAGSGSSGGSGSGSNLAGGGSGGGGGSGSSNSSGSGSSNQCGSVGTSAGCNVNGTNCSKGCQAVGTSFTRPLTNADCAAVGLVGDGKGGCTYPSSGPVFGPAVCDTWDSSCNSGRSKP